MQSCQSSSFVRPCSTQTNVMGHLQVMVTKPSCNSLAYPLKVISERLSHDRKFQAVGEKYIYKAPIFTLKDGNGNNIEVTATGLEPTTT